MPMLIFEAFIPFCNISINFYYFIWHFVLIKSDIAIYDSSSLIDRIYQIRFLMNKTPEKENLYNK